jgi:hypothetical protein
LHHQPYQRAAGAAAYQPLRRPRAYQIIARA